MLTLGSGVFLGPLDLFDRHLDTIAVVEPHVRVFSRKSLFAHLASYADDCFGLHSKIVFASMHSKPLQSFKIYTLTNMVLVSYHLGMLRKLTPKTIDSLPLPVGKRYEVRDTLLTGLAWYLTTRASGRAERIRLGTYPVLSLADARENARLMLRDVQLGTRSSCTPKKEHVPTFVEITAQFIELYAKPRNRDWKGTESVLRKFVVLNDKPMDTIRRADVVRVLDEIVAGGAPFRANRALAAIKKMMVWCVDRGVTEINLIASLKPPTKEVARDRVLDDEELIACWCAADKEPYPFGAFAKLLILTGQRRGEVAGMRWSELDVEKATWTIPAKRAKNATQHVVPLAPTALATLQSVPRFLNSDFVFTTTGRTPISGFGRLKDRLDEASGADGWRLHDIRRTVATNMAMLGIAPHVIEAVLNHKTGIVSGVAATYNRHAYQAEKRVALEGWAGRVEEFKRETRALAPRLPPHEMARFQTTVS